MFRPHDEELWHLFKEKVLCIVSIFQYFLLDCIFNAICYMQCNLPLLYKSIFLSAMTTFIPCTFMLPVALTCPLDLISDMAYVASAYKSWTHLFWLRYPLLRCTGLLFPDPHAVSVAKDGWSLLSSSWNMLNLWVWSALKPVSAILLLYSQRKTSPYLNGAALTLFRE